MSELLIAVVMLCGQSADSKRVCQTKLLACLKAKVNSSRQLFKDPPMTSDMLRDCYLETQ